MPSSAQSIAASDLDRYSEITRRRLYDRLREEFFLIPGDAPRKEDALPYTAEGAALAVHFLWGRWFAVWTRCEVETFRPEADRIEVLRIKASSATPEGWVLSEV